MNRLDKIAVMLANNLAENEMNTVDDVSEFDVNVAAQDLLAVVRKVEELVAPQWRDIEYDRNALIDDIRTALAPLTETHAEGT